MGVSSEGENAGAHVSGGRWFESIIPNNEKEILTSLWTKTLTMASLDPDSGMPVIGDEKDVDTLLSINVAF